MEALLPSLPLLCLVGGVITFLLVSISNTFYTVKQWEVVIIERLGKFARLGGPGLNMKLPFIENIAKRMNMQQRQTDVEMESMTDDKVTVTIIVTVFFGVNRQRVNDAFYLLRDEESRISAFVRDTVRASIPKLTLDEVFAKQEDIAQTTKQQLTVSMSPYGWDIVDVVVVEVDPDEKAKKARNDISAAQSEQIAATSRGETEKILQVKRAEAEKQAKILQGEGIAGQRKAIVEGLRESVNQFQEGVPGSTAEDVMRLVLMTQYFDTLKDIGMGSKSNLIMVPHTPGGLSDISNQLRDSLLVANQAPKPERTSHK